MSILRRFVKPKMNIAELWIRFYDRNFVDPAWSPETYVDDPQVTVETGEEAFEAIGLGPLSHPKGETERKAVEMELFGLAVAQLRPEHSLFEIVSAKIFLEHMQERLDIWDAMGHYNKAIGRWTQRDSSVPIPYGKSEPSRVARYAVDRLSNRMGIPLEAGAPIDLLAATVVRRLRRKLSPDARSLIRSLLRMDYHMAIHEIESVRLV